MRLAALLVLSSLAAAPLAVRAQNPAAHGGAFLVRLGNDTTFVESYTTSRDRMEGDQISRVANRTTLRHFVVTFDGAGNVTRYELTARPAGEPGAAPQRAIESFDRDSATVQVTIGDSSRTRRVAAPPGTVPYVGSSYALIELLTERARSGGASAEPALFNVLPLGAGSAFVVTVQQITADTVALTFGAGTPVKVRVDGAGRVLGANGVGTTQQVTVERVSSVDIPALVSSFANRPLGLLSPRDSVQATVGRAMVSINYGRPSMRGRQIFGALVPWNKVWRTGANAATAFTTSADLVMGGKTIPAGAYTLWTLPQGRTWKLIVNQQTGQSGTQYDSTQDVARLDMKVALLPEAVEQFTISIDPAGSGEILRLTWEMTEASIPLTSR